MIYVGLCAIYGSKISSNLAEVIKHYPRNRVAGVLFMEYPSNPGEGQMVNPKVINETLEGIDLEDSVGGGI